MKKKYIIVDGSNIAFFHRNPKKEPKFENIQLIIKILKETANDYPVDFLIIVDASLRHRINKKEKLEVLERTGTIVQCPRNHQADDFIIEFAQKHPENTIIISNDSFREYETDGLVICNFVIIFNEIIIKPNLTQCLQPLNQIDKSGGVNVCKV